MSDKLPILISIPHGGDVIPPEVKNRVLLTERDIFYDGDALTREIFNFKNQVEALIQMPIARAIIDVNRAPDDRPPENPDGVIKTITTDKTRIYKKNLFPNDQLIEQLIQRYYYPYHKNIDELLDDPEIVVALDCHSMLESSPPISNEPGKPRPLICLSNRGDSNGKPTEERGPVTCPPEWINELAVCFEEIFGEQGEIKINDPFSGGYNSYLHFKNKNKSWIQVEINRSLYLNDKYFDKNDLKVEQRRLRDINGLIFKSFDLFVKRLNF
jgi:formiminoglutamase